MAYTSVNGAIYFHLSGFILPPLPLLPPPPPPPLLLHHHNLPLRLLQQLHHHLLGSPDLQPFCRASHRTTLAGGLLVSWSILRIFPSRWLQASRLSLPHIDLHTASSCHHRFWCLFFVHTWRT